MFRIMVMISFLFMLPTSVLATWDIVKHTDTDNQRTTLVAYTENQAGYSLEIYRDGNGAIRSRFSMNKNQNRLAEKNCPTYQVDKRKAKNRSINDATCISHSKWVEFVLGYIKNNEVISTPLHNMMNGQTITYRFILANEGYAETGFSLAGSKRTLTEILGNTLTVKTENGYINE